MQPLLQFHGGRLRPTTKFDAGFLLEFLNIPEVRRYLCDGKIQTKADVSALLTENERFETDGLGLWLIETDTHGEVGMAGLVPVSGPLLCEPRMAGGIEPTIALEPGAWGQGLARAALSALIHHARDGLKLTSLVAAADAPNAYSHRLLAACGFERTGKCPGVVHELILYQLSLHRPIATN